MGVSVGGAGLVGEWEKREEGGEGEEGGTPGVGHRGLASRTGVEAASPARGSRSQDERMMLLRDS